VCYHSYDSREINITWVSWCAQDELPTVPQYPLRSTHRSIFYCRWFNEYYYCLCHKCLEKSGNLMTGEWLSCYEKVQPSLAVLSLTFFEQFWSINLLTTSDWVICRTSELCLLCCDNKLLLLYHIPVRWTSYLADLRLTLFTGPSIPFSLLSLSLPLPFAFLSPLLPLEVGLLNTARGFGECCRLLQQGLEQSPSGNQIWCILALKSDILVAIFLRINWPQCLWRKHKHCNDALFFFWGTVFFKSGPLNLCGPWAAAWLV